MRPAPPAATLVRMRALLLAAVLAAPARPATMESVYDEALAAGRASPDALAEAQASATARDLVRLAEGAYGWQLARVGARGACGARESWRALLYERPRPEPADAEGEAAPDEGALPPGYERPVARHDTFLLTVEECDTLDEGEGAVPVIMRRLYVVSLDGTLLEAGVLPLLVIDGQPEERDFPPFTLGLGDPETRELWRRAVLQAWRRLALTDL